MTSSQGDCPVKWGLYGECEVPPTPVVEEVSEPEQKRRRKWMRTERKRDRMAMLERLEEDLSDIHYTIGQIMANQATDDAAEADSDADEGDAEDADIIGVCIGE